jgi:hypothetical protein
MVPDFALDRQVDFASTTRYDMFIDLFKFRSNCMKYESLQINSPSCLKSQHWSFL